MSEYADGLDALGRKIVSLQQERDEWEEAYCNQRQIIEDELRPRIAALEAELAQANAWKKAVDDLLAAWYTTADRYATPREAVEALIAFNVMTALDPAVSGDIADIVARSRKEEREACASLCDSLRTVIIDGALVPAMPSHCAAAILARKP